jgi:hypothetical protein
MTSPSIAELIERLRRKLGRPNNLGEIMDEAAEALSTLNEEVERLTDLLEAALPHVRFSQASGGHGAKAVAESIDTALQSSRGGE